MQAFNRAISDEYRIDIKISGCPVLRKATPKGWLALVIADKDDEDRWIISDIPSDATWFVNLGKVSEDEAIAYMWDNRADGGIESQSAVSEDCESWLAALSYANYESEVANA